MNCADCAKLYARREAKKHIYELAVLRVSTADPSADAALLTMLKTVVEKSRIDLNSVEEEIEKHRENRHS